MLPMVPLTKKTLRNRREGKPANQPHPAKGQRPRHQPRRAAWVCVHPVAPAWQAPRQMCPRFLSQTGPAFPGGSKTGRVDGHVDTRRISRYTQSILLSRAGLLYCFSQETFVPQPAPRHAKRAIWRRTPARGSHEQARHLCRPSSFYAPRHHLRWLGRAHSTDSADALTAENDEGRAPVFAGCLTHCVQFG
jgi:hypothetical protein